MRATDLWVIAPWTLAACGGGAVAITPVEEWTTEAEYEIGDRMQGDALFGQIRDVRPSADGSRVYVLDAAAAQVTIWTPDGTLIGRVGRRGEGPGEFQSPTRLALFHDRFYVKDARRITTFTLDGEVTGTATYPSGVIYRGFPAINPGLIELIEISTTGDTIWTRRIQLPPVPLTEDDVEVEDTPGVWYAVRKGADEGPIRRITVPESFQPRDVTATHVWGIRHDELDVGYVTGLRLVPGQETGSQ